MKARIKLEYKDKTYIGIEEETTKEKHYAISKGIKKAIENGISYFSLQTENGIVHFSSKIIKKSIITIETL